MGLFGIGKKKYDLDLDKEIGSLGDKTPAPTELNNSNHQMNSTGLPEQKFNMNNPVGNTGSNTNTFSSDKKYETKPYMGQEGQDSNFQARQQMAHPQNFANANNSSNTQTEIELLKAKIDTINSKLDLILNKINFLDKKNDEKEKTKYW